MPSDFEGKWKLGFLYRDPDSRIPHHLDGDILSGASVGLGIWCFLRWVLDHAQCCTGVVIK